MEVMFSEAPLKTEGSIQCIRHTYDGCSSVWVSLKTHTPYPFDPRGVDHSPLLKTSHGFPWSQDFSALSLLTDQGPRLCGVSWGDVSRCLLTPNKAHR